MALVRPIAGNRARQGVGAMSRKLGGDLRAAIARHAGKAACAARKTLASRATVTKSVKRATVALADKVGIEKPTGVARQIKNLAARASRKLKTAPQHAARPRSYWPIALIATAIAESAHAPLGHGAQAAWKNPPAHSSESFAKNGIDPQAKTHSDMHGPGFPTDKPVKDSPKPPDEPLPDTRLLVDPMMFHIDPLPIDPHAPIDLIHTGGGGIIRFDPGGGTGGGGAIISGGGGGGTIAPTGGGGRAHSGEGGRGGGASGGTDTSGGGSSPAGGSGAPIVQDSSGTVSVPEPGSISVMLAGVVMLGRRRNPGRI